MIKIDFLMYKRPVETIMGILVLAVAGLFCYFAYSVSDLQVVKGYNVSANFLKVGGLNTGSDVRINGIKIGTVVSQKLNDEDYTAALKQKLHEEVGEYLQDNTIEELADIIEVVEALAENQGSSLREVMEFKQRKQNKNGAFRDKIFLISVER